MVTIGRMPESTLSGLLDECWCEVLKRHLKPIGLSDDAVSAASDGGPHGFNRSCGDLKLLTPDFWTNAGFYIGVDVWTNAGGRMLV